jgi:hypothetical protein
MWLEMPDGVLLSHMGMGLRRLVGLWLFSALVGCGFAQAQDAKAMIATLVQHEAAAAEHRGHYTYTSEERSERTGGHLWQERVAETNWGKVRYLTAVDGQALTGEKLAAEKARVAGEASDPEAFKRSEAARVDDEQHAKQMLELLPKAFLFGAPVNEGEYVRISFTPNPNYSPQSLEERVLHGMSGSVLVDAKTIRLRGIEGRMEQEVSIGFGLLATIHAGSNFSTTREHVGGDDWKTELLHTDINGKALFLKTIARQQDAKHWGFQKIADNMTVTDAVSLLEQ